MKIKFVILKAFFRNFLWFIFIRLVDIGICKKQLGSRFLAVLQNTGSNFKCKKVFLNCVQSQQMPQAWNILITVYVMVHSSQNKNLFCCSLKYLALKVGQLRQASGSRGILTQAFNQPYGVSCVTEHVFEGVQWDYANNMKMMPRNISSPLNLPYPNICAGSWVGANNNCFPKNSPSVLASQHNDTDKRLWTVKSAHKNKLGASAIQRAKI